MGLKERRDTVGRFLFCNRSYRPGLWGCPERRSSSFLLSYPQNFEVPCGTLGRGVRKAQELTGLWAQHGFLVAQPRLAALVALHPPGYKHPCLKFSLNLCFSLILVKH